MADRVSTIRFKTAGLESVPADIRRAFTQAATELARANKMFEEASVGRARGGVDLAGIEANERKAAEIYASADLKRQKAWKAVEADMDAQYQTQKKHNERIVAEREKLEFGQAAAANKAATKAYDESQSSEAARLKSAIQSREAAVQAQFKTESKLLDDRDTQAAQSNKVATAAIDQEMETRAAALRNDILAREKADQDAFKAESAKLDEKEKAAAATAKELTKIDEEYYATTMTRQENELRKLNDWYAAKRVQHENNARALARIDATYDAKRKQIMGNGAVGNETLGGFGAKMVLGHAAGMALGDVTGDTKLGQMSGALLSGFLFGGPYVGAAIAGLGIFTEAVKVHRESVAAAAKAAGEFATTMTNLAAAWSGMTVSQVRESGLGSMLRKEAERSGSGISVASAKLLELGSKPEMLNFEWLTGENSPFTSQYNSAQRQLQVELESHKAARTYLASEQANFQADQAALATSQVVALGIAPATPSMLRQQLELDAKINTERVKRVALHNEENRAAALGLTRSQKAVDLLKEQLTTASKNPKSTQAEIGTILTALSVANERLEDAKLAAGILPGQQTNENAVANAQAARDRAVLAFTQAEMLARGAAQLGIAQVGAASGQYDRQFAMRDARYREEIRQAAMQGPVIEQMKRDEISALIEIETQGYVEEQQIKVRYAEAAAYTDKYYRAKAVREAQEDEERKEAAARGTLAAKNEEIAARESLRHGSLMEEQQLRTNEAVAAAATEGYARQVALRKLAFDEQLRIAEAEGADMLALKQKEIDALQEVERKDNRRRIEDAMASFSPASAVSRLKRQIDDAKAMGATDAEAKALKDEALTGAIRRQTEHDKIDLAVKTRRINQMQADVLNALVDNPLARAKGPEGEAVRKAIVQDAAVKEMLRGADPIKVGEFSTKFQAGFVDISRVNMDRQLDQKQLQQRANMIAERMLAVLETMASNGGLG